MKQPVYRYFCSLCGAQFRTLPAKLAHLAAKHGIRKGKK